MGGGTIEALTTALAATTLLPPLIEIVDPALNASAGACRFRLVLGKLGMRRIAIYPRRRAPTNYAAFPACTPTQAHGHAHAADAEAETGSAKKTETTTTTTNAGKRKEPNGGEETDCVHYADRKLPTGKGKEKKRKNKHA